MAPGVSSTPARAAYMGAQRAGFRARKSPNYAEKGSSSEVEQARDPSADEFAPAASEDGSLSSHEAGSADMTEEDVEDEKGEAKKSMHKRKRTGARGPSVSNAEPRASSQLLSSGERKSRSKISSPKPRASGRSKGRTAKKGSLKEKRKVSSPFDFLLPAFANPTSSTVAVAHPSREHAVSYHRPALLNNSIARTNLLQWFDSVRGKRGMPWRKDFISPLQGDPTKDDEMQRPKNEEVREILKRRAYEVWISEIMLQQTRVETVRSYWLSWTSRWPTIEALAAASSDEVLSAWRGLGYYSRATRIHTAAQKVVQHPEWKGLLPMDPVIMEKEVPGVGRYTAGAISSIVFGLATPILDGNIARVLSRQVALYANPKAKSTIDLLWAVADALVQAATRSGISSGAGAKENVEGKDEVLAPSAVPGAWNQALMELGSTICTPTKPDCAACPVRDTCSSLSEGKALAAHANNNNRKPPLTSASALCDIEELCSICDTLDLIPDANGGQSTVEYESDGDDVRISGEGVAKKTGGRHASKAGLKLKQQTLNFGSAPVNQSSSSHRTDDKDAATTSAACAVIAAHVIRFPMQVVKSAVRKEECVVCAVRWSAGEPRAGRDVPKRRKVGSAHDAKSGGVQQHEYLIEQRPDKGLLASLWQFPSFTLPETVNTPSGRARAAQDFVTNLLGPKADRKPIYRGALGSVPHVFSHLKLTMHVHLVELVRDADTSEGLDMAKVVGHRMRWATGKEVEAENMGTGMRRCWALVQSADT